jgi:holin-like protein
VVQLRGLPRTAIQTVAFIGLWLLADQLSRRLGLPIPGGVVGLGILAALLFAGWLPLRMVQQGADWLLAEMLLFFIPPLMAVVDAGPLIAQVGWRLLVVLPIGCVLVMVGTGLAVDRVFHYEQRRHAEREAARNA